MEAHEYEALCNYLEEGTYPPQCQWEDEKTKEKKKLKRRLREKAGKMKLKHGVLYMESHKKYKKDRLVLKEEELGDRRQEMHIDILNACSLRAAV
jgi:hypothetical protein